MGGAYWCSRGCCIWRRWCRSTAWSWCKAAAEDCWDWKSFFFILLFYTVILWFCVCVRVCVCQNEKESARRMASTTSENRKRNEKKSTEQEEAHFVSRVTVILTREKERDYLLNLDMSQSTCFGTWIEKGVDFYGWQWVPRANTVQKEEHVCVCVCVCVCVNWRWHWKSEFFIYGLEGWVGGSSEILMFYGLRIILYIYRRPQIHYYVFLQSSVKERFSQIKRS